MCLLDLEETLVPGTMRATGDWVKVRGEQLQYLGRRDRLIKRHGKRVSLDSVQQVRFFSSTLQFVQVAVGGAAGCSSDVAVAYFAGL